MKITNPTNFPKATQEEINKLRLLVRRIPNPPKAAPEVAVPASAPQTPPSLPTSTTEPSAPPPTSSKRVDNFRNLFNGGIGKVEITREPLKIDNAIEWLLLLKPELTPYRWQFEELMRLSGYLDPKDLKTKTYITDKEPLKMVIPAANGSGKDEVIIATFATFFVVTGIRNRVIITSSSFDQTKFQTETHIRDLCQRANKKYGLIFRYTQFHYIVPDLGGEIKLFATDEPGRAEGYHPYHQGRMAIILNEAKTINEDLFGAIDRCTGYSHLLYISSPGVRRGRFYKAAGQAIHYPAPAQLGKYFCRKVTAYECEHIAKSHIDAMVYEKGEDSPWVRSSIKAEFSDFDEPVVIPEYVWDRCFGFDVPLVDSDIGIGLDLAGGGDENSIHVREGNHLIFDYHFTQKDTTITVGTIDKALSAWKEQNYTFRADNGGIGQAIIDGLVELGWRIRRTNNQSPAWSKKDFLNLGAELYFKVKRLIERFEIKLPNNKPKLKYQLTTRRYKGQESTQGKLALQSKEEARAEGLDSPDRADSFVLCFSSYTRKRVSIPAPTLEDSIKKYTIPELLQLERRGLLILGNNAKQRQIGPPSQIVKI